MGWGTEIGRDMEGGGGDGAYKSPVGIMYITVAAHGCPLGHTRAQKSDVKDGSVEIR